MTSIKIFQVEKNAEEIRSTVLTNIVKMLYERKLIKKENITNKINELIKTQSDENIYNIIVDFPENNDAKIIIKLINQKITAISKQSIISDFLIKYKDNNKIIIVKNISTKPYQYILNNYNNAEIFLEENLLINLVDHVFVSKYEKLKEKSDEYINFGNIYNCKKRNIPKLLFTDPMARYYNLKKGDIVRILRPSEATGYSPSYRIVI